MGITGSRPKHCHIEWDLVNGDRIGFIDPRRFGELWTFGGYQDLLQSRWSTLGDDALLITLTALSKRLACTTRPLKTALLDQNLIAGLGNIYVDELCFNCKIRPDRIASEMINLKISQKLVREMRKLLKQAIKQDGSILRDYVMVNGQSGQFQNLHKIYGRTGQHLCHLLVAIAKDASSRSHHGVLFKLSTMNPQDFKRLKILNEFPLKGRLLI